MSVAWEPGKAPVAMAAKLTAASMRALARDTSRQNFIVDGSSAGRAGRRNQSSKRVAPVNYCVPCKYLETASERQWTCNFS